MRSCALTFLRASAATPALLLLLGCDAKGVKETKASGELAAKQIQDLMDEATDKGLKEREKNRSEEPLDWPALAQSALMKFQASSEARAQQNAFNPGKPVYLARAEGDEPGAVYLDASRAATGAIFVTAVFKDGASVKRDTKTVTVNISARPPKLDVEPGAMPHAPSL